MRHTVCTIGNRTFVSDRQVLEREQKNGTVEVTESHGSAD